MSNADAIPPQLHGAWKSAHKAATWKTRRTALILLATLVISLGAFLLFAMGSWDASPLMPLTFIMMAGAVAFASGQLMRAQALIRHVTDEP